MRAGQLQSLFCGPFLSCLESPALSLILHRHHSWAFFVFWSKFPRIQHFGELIYPGKPLWTCVDTLGIYEHWLSPTCGFYNHVTLGAYIGQIAVSFSAGWVWIPAPPLSGWVTLSSLFHHFTLNSLICKMEKNDSTFYIGLFWRHKAFTLWCKISSSWISVLLLINWFTPIWYQYQPPIVQESKGFLLLHWHQTWECDPCHLWTPSCAEVSAFSTGENGSLPSRVLSSHPPPARPCPAPQTLDR